MWSSASITQYEVGAASLTIYCFFYDPSVLSTYLYIFFLIYSLEIANGTENEDKVRSISKQVHDAFCTTGFVYLTNHGIDSQLVS